jgi:hypothetical protein
MGRETQTRAIGLFSDWHWILPRIPVHAAADVRLAARPDLIDKLFDISESSLRHC